MINLNWDMLFYNVLTTIPPTVLALAGWIQARNANKNSAEANKNSAQASAHAMETKEIAVAAQQQLTKTDESINGRVDELVRATKEKAMAEATLAERERRGLSRSTDIGAPSQEFLLKAAEERARLLIEEAGKQARKLIMDARKLKKRRRRIGKG